MAQRLLVFLFFVGWPTMNSNRANGDGNKSLDDWFSQAVQEGGKAYIEARSALLKPADEAERFLEEKRKSVLREEQWLAEILLARLHHSEDLSRREQEFHEKVFLLAYGYPNMRQMGMEWPRVPGLLFVPSEPIFDEESRERLERVWGELAPHVEAYFESLRISDSPLWPLLLGELLLKGWVPDAAVRNPELAHSSRSGRAGHQKHKKYDEENRKRQLPAFRSGRLKPLQSEDYEVQAMALLGKLGERRAGPALLRFLQDERRFPTHRAVAAFALGELQFKDSLPTLLGLCRSAGTPGVLQLAAFRAVGAIEDVNVLPELEHIAKHPEEKQPSQPPDDADAGTRLLYSTTDARNRADNARKTIRRLRVSAGAEDSTP